MEEAIVKRDEFGAMEIATTGETVASVLAARAKAEVEARFIMAMKRPRDMHLVRRKLLDACERPGFAGSAREKVWGAAWFLKPIGDGIEGFSIRFAEEAMRCMGNMDARSSVVWEDDAKRIISVEVMDLENNISIPTTIVVQKRIERRYLKRGETAISTRINSEGNPVYLRAATDDEVMQVQNSLISKAMRNGILRLLPGDIQAECRERILQIRHGDAAKDPRGFSKKVVDSFAGIGVSPGDLVKYLGHPIENCSPVELTTLRDLFDAIRKGETTWAEVIKSVTVERGEDAPKEEDDAKGLDGVTKKIKNKQKAKKEVKAEPSAVDHLTDLATQRYGDKADAVIDAFLEGREKMREDLDEELAKVLIADLEG